MRRLAALTLAVSTSACVTVPPPQAAPVVAPSVAVPPSAPSFVEKQSWILRLEDERVLRDASAPDTASGAASAGPAPDLIRLLSDEDGRIRRRAALAVGRVGLKEGVPALIALLADPEPEIRQMAAFALGLIGDARARDPLLAALEQESPVVEGSAAEALGRIGDLSTAPAIGRMASRILQAAPLADLLGREVDDRRDTPAAAFRLALYALTQLKAYDSLAAVVLDGSGQPRVRSWPVAFALQRIEDRRALPALLALLREADPYTRAFAAKGLGALKDRSAVPPLLSLASGPDRAVAIEAIRALGRIGDATAAPLFLRLIQARSPDPFLRLEAVSALGGVREGGSVDPLIDLLADRDPAMRAAALRSLAQLDLQAFITVLSGLDPDPQPSVRSALASILGTLPPEVALPRLRTMIADPDDRVIPSVLASLTTLRAPEAGAILVECLTAEDAVVREAAATGLGELKPQGAARALAEAYRFGARDLDYVARAAALGALAAYGAPDAIPVLTEALQDPDWAVRVRAAALLRPLDPTSDVDARIRPAPVKNPARYRENRVVDPQVSTQAFIDTDRGSIQLELAVLDAPLTVENFVALARQGFFNGLTVHRVVPDFVIQTGDPRGDSEGGPGYTIRNEINQLAYLRGTVGMALDWADTGGSQFFITHSPQPHLDGRYTIFGRVISGMEVVDAIQQGDVIRRVMIWDGTDQ